jgi:hypothetical protein
MDPMREADEIETNRWEVLMEVAMATARKGVFDS